MHPPTPALAAVCVLAQKVEFDAISGRLITVPRKLVHDEATLTAPRPMVAPSHIPSARANGFGSRPDGGAQGGSDYGAPGPAYPQTPLHHSMTPMHPSMTPAHPSMTPAMAPYTPMHAPTPTPGDDNDFMLGGGSGYQVRRSQLRRPLLLLLPPSQQPLSLGGHVAPLPLSLPSSPRRPPPPPLPPPSSSPPPQAATSPCWCPACVCPAGQRPWRHSLHPRLRQRPHAQGVHPQHVPRVRAAPRAHPLLA